MIAKFPSLSSKTSGQVQLVALPRAEGGSPTRRLIGAAGKAPLNSGLVDTEVSSTALTLLQCANPQEAAVRVRSLLLDELGDVVGRGEGAPLARTGIDLGCRVGELDDVFVAVGHGSVDRLRGRVRRVRQVR